MFVYIYIYMLAINQAGPTLRTGLGKIEGVPVKIKFLLLLGRIVNSKAARHTCNKLG